MLYHHGRNSMFNFIVYILCIKFYISLKCRHFYLYSFSLRAKKKLGLQFYLITYIHRYLIIIG